MKALHTLDEYIKKNIANPAIQKIIFFDILLLALLLLVSLCTLGQSTFFLWIFLGGILSFWNFFFVAIFIQKYFNSKLLGTKSDKILPFGQILISNLRLFITGFLLYIFLTRWNAHPIALFIGVSIPVATIPILLIYNKKI
jgi:hypothetical protein